MNYLSIIKEITENYTLHSKDNDFWKLKNEESKGLAQENFSSVEPLPVDFGPFGRLYFPYHSMGNITSINLFGVDELIIFAFYWANRTKYRNVLDLGANLGLHTIIMQKCGFNVRSFEPDPIHMGVLSKNLGLNQCESDIHQAAISTQDGIAEFTRVKGNTTGSHLSGAKESPYGDLERFTVVTESALPHLEWADLAKIDIEGHEAELICNLPADIWKKTDAIMEIGTAKNAEAIFNYLNGKVNLFAQKNGWQKVKSPLDLPNSHHEGSVFVSAKENMYW